MSKLSIVKIPDDRLRQRSREILDSEITTEEMTRLIADMTETMIGADGVGLAAPQIGKNIRLIIVKSPKGPAAFFNPEIIKKSRSTFINDEGCLSVPNRWGPVERHKKITVVAKDSQGHKIKMKATGLMSIILQHEIDHLDGVLFIDKLWKK